MTDLSGSYRFIAWARSGLAAASSVTLDGSRLSLEVTLEVRLGESPDSGKVIRKLHLYGPGDVVGLDAKQIIRREPPPGTVDFEPNYFPLVEFDAPELPWLFSPELDRTKPRPWLTLVVLRREDATILTDPRAPLPWLSLAKDLARAELPDMSEAWAWAHAQIAGSPEENLWDALDGRNPERTLSRILCPRRLQQRQRYVACLVPVYQAGVQAGRGRPVDAGTEKAWPPLRDDDAWNKISGPLELPIYDQWEFTTGEVGDFEVLARRLRAKPVDPEIGGVSLDVSHPDPAFADLGLGSPLLLTFEGALTALKPNRLGWPTKDVETEFKQRLEGLIEADPGVNETVLRPPIYGAFHAGTGDQLPPPEAGRPWMWDLNLEPGWRAAAALGTQVVQKLQEELMASAWDQAGEIERANAMLRQAQLARATATAILDKHINSGLPPDSLARLTQPLHSRVRLTREGSLTKGQTLHGSVKQSIFPQAALSPPFRRALRPAGPLGRRLPEPATSRMSEDLAGGTLHVRPHPASGGVGFDEVSKASGGNQHLKDLGTYKGAGRWDKIVGEKDGFYSDRDPYKPEPPPAPSPTPAPTPAPPPAGFAATTAVTAELSADEVRPAVSDGAGSDGSDLSAERLDNINTRFLKATEALWSYLSSLPTDPPPEALSLALTTIGSQLTDRKGVLAPDQTVALEVVTLVDGPRAKVARSEAEPAPPAPAPDLTLRAATPHFSQPMVEPLLSIDREMLLPGVDRIDADSAGLLVGNSSFIEAYMAGINHELSRELLWRGLPADLAATFADRFWDIRGRVEPDTPQIPRIADEWFGTLGDNADGVGETGMLVLIIRGRLLQRYPHTAIYATEAVLDAASLPTLAPPPAEVYPVFRGTIDPDITYLGFRLDEAQVRGGPGKPGWFFVIQEQPTAPRFGLDEPDEKHASLDPTKDSWAKLDWLHVVENPSDLQTVRHVSVAGPLAASKDPPERPAMTMPVLDKHSETATWDTDAAQMAAITYQRPMRIAIHASTMLPEPEKKPSP